MNIYTHVCVRVYMYVYIQKTKFKEPETYVSTHSGINSPCNTTSPWLLKSETSRMGAPVVSL